MNYVFFGSPEFAAIILAKLIESNLIPSALVCNPDRPFGRAHILTPPRTKRLIMELELNKRIQLMQPEDPREIQLPLAALKPELFVVAAYAKILPSIILSIPSHGTLGVHPSLLPKYRGVTPIQSAILAGEKETGVTLFLIDEKADHGPILASQSVPLDTHNYTELLRLLAHTAGDLIRALLPNFEKEAARATTQDETRATYTKKFKTEHGFVPNALLEEAKESGGDNAMLVMTKIRALNPEPGVYTIDTLGRRVKLLDAEIIDGKLHILKIQKEGGKPRAA